MKRLIPLILTVLLGLMPLSLAAQAPDPDNSAAVDTLDLDNPDAIRALVARLSDSEVRALLLQKLDAENDARRLDADESESPLVFLRESIFGIGQSIYEAVIKVPHLLEGHERAIANFTAARADGGVMRFVGVLLGAILLGLVSEGLATWTARDWRARIAEYRPDDSLRQILHTLGLRLLLDLVGLIAFFAAIHLVIAYVASSSDQPLLQNLVLNLLLIPRLIAALMRFVLAPQRSDLRLVHTDDQTARFLFRHMIGLTVMAGLTVGTIQFHQMNGVPAGEFRLGFWFNLAIHIYLGVIAWLARDGLTMMLSAAADEITDLEQRAARVYPYYAIGVSIGMWLLVEILVAQQRLDLLIGGVHYWTMFLLLIAPVMDTLIRALVSHLTPPMQGEGAIAEEAYFSTKRCNIRMGRAILFVLVIVTIAGMWGIEFSNLAAAGIGARAAAALAEVGFVLAVGYILWEVSTLWIDRKLAAEQTAAGVDPQAEEPAGEGGGAGASRLSTILPLLRRVVQVLIVTMTVLIALGHIGIDVTPLLAGAGIVGLAIGFGAQKLVTDVVSGVFFLVDDAFRAGEFVEVEGTMGIIEKISFRALQLRHHLGAVHTIPYGEIPKISNYSRDWVIMKLRFTVPFDTDLNKVKKIFKQIGSDIVEHPELGDFVIQPFKSQGVLEVNDVGIVVRGKFMAKPGMQYPLRKEIYQQVQKRFDENDIQFARKEVRVKIDGSSAEDLDDQAQQAIAAAASESEPPAAPAAANPGDDR